MEHVRECDSIVFDQIPTHFQDRGSLVGSIEYPTRTHRKSIVFCLRTGLRRGKRGFFIARIATLDRIVSLLTCCVH